MAIEVNISRWTQYLTERPEVAFPLAATLSGHFDEALVQRQIVPDGVLPSLFVLLEVRELSGNVCIDLAESCPFLRAMLYRHGDQGHIAEGRLGVRRGRSTVGTISVVRTGCGGGHGTVRRGRGGCGRCRGIAIGGTVKGAYRRRTLVVQMMMRRTGSGRGGMHGDHRVRAMQTVMGMVMMMMMAQGYMM